MQFALGIAAESPECSVAQRGLAADSPAGGNVHILMSDGVNIFCFSRDCFVPRNDVFFISSSTQSFLFTPSPTHSFTHYNEIAFIISNCVIISMRPRSSSTSTAMFSLLIMPDILSIEVFKSTNGNGAVVIVCTG
ncbi:hypothetical protein QE417_001469 [Mucilaginibacter terrae]|uniref:Uncharacterized protein n=1 Tax=Mucilaginibacter terrae TaxID=1955052 RepID=A0ABU3GTV1_9SPHI|nr:hypothetical protein [Mucilaginibacter terrae]